jgi:hypothetical protein
MNLFSARNDKQTVRRYPLDSLEADESNSLEDDENIDFDSDNDFQDFDERRNNDLDDTLEDKDDKFLEGSGSTEEEYSQDEGEIPTQQPKISGLNYQFSPGIRLPNNIPKGTPNTKMQSKILDEDEEEEEFGGKLQVINSFAV